METNKQVKRIKEMRKFLTGVKPRVRNRLIKAVVGGDK